MIVKNQSHNKCMALCFLDFVPKKCFADPFSLLFPWNYWMIVVIRRGAQQICIFLSCSWNLLSKLGFGIRIPSSCWILTNVVQVFCWFSSSPRRLFRANISWISCSHVIFRCSTSLEDRYGLRVIDQRGGLTRVNTSLFPKVTV